MFNNTQAFNIGNQIPTNQIQSSLFGNNNNSNPSSFNQGLQTPQKPTGLNGTFNGFQNLPPNQNQPVTNGSFSYKFAPVRLNDNKDSVNIMNISAVPQFQLYSVEEIKLMDLQLKQKGMVYNPNQQSNQMTLNSNTAFSNLGNQNQTSLFISQNPQSTFGNQFGQQQQPSSLFGQQQNSVFNNSTTQPNSLFGNQQAANSNGQFSNNSNNGNTLFGATQQTNNLFGANSNNNNTNNNSIGTSGLFGASQTNSNSNLFGSQMNKTQSNTLFGNTNTNTNNTNSLFNNSTSSLFGSTNNNNSNNFLNKPQSTQQQSSLFGGSTQQQSSLFGTSNQQQTNNNSSSLFGSSNNNNASNLFSAQNNQQQSLFNNLQGPTVSLFNNTQPQASSNTSLFGSSQPSNNSSLFNSTSNNNTSSLFNNAKPQTTGSLFGNAPISGSLFGNTMTTGNNSLFSSIPTPASNNNQNLPVNTNATQVDSNQYPPHIIQQYCMGIDINELPPEIVDGLKEQKDIKQIQKDLEEKYDKEIKASLLYNQLTSTDRQNNQDYFLNEGIDFSNEYFKSRYNYNSIQKKEIKIKIKPTKYQNQKNNNLKLSNSAYSLASLHSALQEKEDKSMKNTSKTLFSRNQKIIIKISNKQYDLPIPDPSTSIHSLKNIIRSNYLKNIPSNELSLIHKNQILLERNTLRHYNINEDSIIEVIKNNNITIVSPVKDSQAYQQRVANVEDIPKISISKYKITPDYKEICRMSSDELQHVSNFTISNEYGEIKFLKEVNLLGLNIDDIITIEHLKVNIYNNGNQPPKGEELNVPKLITVNQLYISKEEEEKLMEQIKNNHAVFISYDKATGVLNLKEE